MSDEKKASPRPAIEDDDERPSSEEERVTEASMESFPASDPPAWIPGSASPNEDGEEGDQRG